MNKYLIIILIIPSILVAQEFFSLKKTKSDYIKVDGILSHEPLKRRAISSSKFNGLLNVTLPLGTSNSKYSS